MKTPNITKDNMREFSGSVPEELKKIIGEAQPRTLPLVVKLPPPRGRCPICGASRSWMIETNAREEAEGRGFIFRVRQPGKQKGACFVNVKKLLTFLAAAEAEDHA